MIFAKVRVYRQAENPKYTNKPSRAWDILLDIL